MNPDETAFQLSSPIRSRMVKNITEEAKVSILMPARNVELYVRKAIISILEQTYSNWELLIGEDASSDGTEEEIQKILDEFKDSRILFHRNENRLGYHRTCNRLAELASGDYITFQDADDYSSSDRISKLVSCMIMQPDLGLIGSGYSIIREDERVIQTVMKPERHEQIRTEILRSNPFCGATIMVRRDVYENIGLYRPFFEGRSHQDFDWAYRVSDKHQTYNIQEPLYFYRQNPNGNSKKIDPERYIGLELALHLGKQREETGGKDDLMSGNEDAVNKYIYDILISPYRKDPSLIYRIYAANYMYSMLFKQARRAAWNALIIRPMRFDNVRTLIYCVRKSPLKSFF
jgi:glycosyltransferase involved in cell wall biosynthesis